MANKGHENLIPFKKGDKRINRGGRPKSFDKLRKLALKVAAEEAGESGLSRVQLMLMAMASSKNPSDRKLFLEYAYGKVKEELEINSKTRIEVRLAGEDD